MGAAVGRLLDGVARNRATWRDGGLALLVAATTALVAAVLTGGGGSDARATLTTEASSSPTSLPLAGVVPDLSAAVPSVATATAGAMPWSASPVTATPGADQPAPAVAVPARTPAPTYPGPGLRVEVSAMATGSLTARAAVRVRDTDGRWNGGFIDFGDGKRQEFGQAVARCAANGSAAAAPSDVTQTFRHTYAASGSYDVVVYIRSERLCSAAPVEYANRRVRVRVSGPAPASPSTSGQPAPAPTASASPEPTGEPSPKPSGGPRSR